MGETPSRYDPKATDEFVHRYASDRSFGCTHEVLCMLEGQFPRLVDPEDERVKEVAARCRKAYGMVD